MPTAELKTKITGDSAEFKRSLKEGIDAAKEFGSEVGSQMKETLLQVSALVLGVEGIKDALEKTFEGVKGVFDLSRDLRNLSNQTGASIKDLVQLRAEFDLSGIASDNVGNVLNKMQRSIEEAGDKGGKVGLVFSRLGIDIRQLQQLDPAQQFEQIRKAISSIEDPARRAQVAMELFSRGGSGGSILAVFGNSKIAQEASDVISQQANILARNAETFQEVSIMMETAGIKLQGFFVGMAEPISRVLLPMLVEFNSIDFAKWGSQLGTSISGAVRILYNAFEDGKLEQLIKLTFSTAFNDAVNIFAGDLYASLNAIGNVVLSIFDPKMLLSFGNILVGSAEAFEGAMLHAQGQAFGLLTNPEFWLGVGEIAAGGFIKLQEELFKIGFSFGELLASIFRNSAGVLAGVVKDVFFIPLKLFKEGEELGAKVAAMLTPQDKAIAQAQAKGDTHIVRDILGELSTGNLLGSGETHIKNAWNTRGNNIFAEGGDRLSGVGDKLAKEGLSSSAELIKSVLSKFQSDISSGKPINILGDDGKALSDLISSLQKNIPGEGKENEPNKPFGGGDNFGFGGELKGIHKGGDGQWSYFSSSGQGAVSFGNNGAAGRAGRVEQSPNGKSPNEIFSDMSKYLKDIDDLMKGIAAPA